MEEIHRTVYEGVDVDELSYDEREEINELVYERTFSAIASNDPSVTAFRPIDLPLWPLHRCAQRLGHALVNNNHVQWIQLYLDCAWFGPSGHMTSLLQYLRQGKALRRVDVELSDYIDYDDADYENLQLVLQALTESRSLETLKLGIEHSLPLYVEVTPDVSRLIQTTTSLRELEMTWTDDHDITTAFVSNRTIEVLRLTSAWGNDNNIRGHLFSNYVAQSSAPSLLTELSVEFDRRTMHLPELDIALCMFLQSAVPSLQKLCVRSMAFDGERTKLFLDGIRYHKTLDKLELILCCFNDDATRSFIKFWQNDVGTTTGIENGYNDNNAPQQPQYNIKSLYICRDVRDDNNTSDTVNMAQMLALSLQNYCSLERLHWAPIHHLNYNPVQFWKMLSDNASKTRLSSLRLDGNDNKGYEAMLRFLPKLQHLREFQCKRSSDPANQIPEHVLLKMVRTNGSLFRFPDDDVYDDDNDNEKNLISIWDRHPAAKPRIRAYFQRNEQLPQLLMSPRMDGNYRHAEHEHSNVETPPSIRLMPLLFAAAQPVTYLAPNNILAGLLKLVDPIGSQFNNEVAQMEV